MGQILDTVPNHMGVVGNENAWWNDVLENGPSSPYAGYFDIAWQALAAAGTAGQRSCCRSWASRTARSWRPASSRLAFADGAFSLHYFDHRFPVAPHSYAPDPGAPAWTSWSAPWAPDVAALHEYQSILTAVSATSPTARRPIPTGSRSASARRR